MWNICFKVQRTAMYILRSRQSVLSFSGLDSRWKISRVNNPRQTALDPTAGSNNPRWSRGSSSRFSQSPSIRFPSHVSCKYRRPPLRERALRATRECLTAVCFQGSHKARSSCVGTFDAMLIRQTRRGALDPESANIEESFGLLYSALSGVPRRPIFPTWGSAGN